jgi:hypothetical protein
MLAGRMVEFDAARKQKGQSKKDNAKREKQKGKYRKGNARMEG